MIPLDRLKMLTDIIFATAMTLMAFTIDVPAGNLELTNEEILDFLGDQLQSFAVFFISFVVVAIYWVKSAEQFALLRETNQTHTWLHLLYLACLVLVPFTNQFASEFARSAPAVAIYCASIFLLGAFASAGWAYATRSHRLVDPAIDPEEVARIMNEARVEPTVAVIAAASLLINPAIWEVCLLVIPLVFLGRRRMRPRRG